MFVDSSRKQYKQVKFCSAEIYHQLQQGQNLIIYKYTEEIYCLVFLIDNWWLTVFWPLDAY